MTAINGVSHKNFTFYDKGDYCDYRVVVNSNGDKEIIFPIETSRRQAFNKGSKSKSDQ